MPAFMVFSDATLREMAEKKPMSIDELLNISGVGEKKAAATAMPSCASSRMPWAAESREKEEAAAQTVQRLLLSSVINGLRVALALFC